MVCADLVEGDFAAVAQCSDRLHLLNGFGVGVFGMAECVQHQHGAADDGEADRQLEERGSAEIYPCRQEVHPQAFAKIYRREETAINDGCGRG